MLVNRLVSLLSDVAVVWIQLMVLPLLLVGQWFERLAEFASATRSWPGRLVGRSASGPGIRDLRSPTYDRGILGNDPRVPGTRGSGPDTAQGNHPNRGLEPKWELLAVRNRIAELAAKTRHRTSHATSR